MPAPYSTAVIANWFLDRAETGGEILDPMKLQKTVYFAHGWYLALTGKPLIEENIQAWDYGPVLPSIYHQFKRFGRDPITDRATQHMAPAASTGNRLRDFLQTRPTKPTGVDDPGVEAFLERIWQVYGNLSAVQLANLSHVPGGAWDKAHGAAQGKRGFEIDNELIRQEFSEKQAKTRAAAE